MVVPNFQRRRKFAVCRSSKEQRCDDELYAAECERELLDKKIEAGDGLWSMGVEEPMWV